MPFKKYFICCVLLTILGCDHQRKDESKDVINPSAGSVRLYLSSHDAWGGHPTTKAGWEKVVKTFSPDEYARMAFHGDDKRLMGIHSYAWSIPSISVVKDFKIIDKYGIVRVDGISDTTSLDEEGLDFRHRATRYAAEYNKEMLTLLGLSKHIVDHLSNRRHTDESDLITPDTPDEIPEDRSPDGADE